MWGPSHLGAPLSSVIALSLHISSRCAERHLQLACVVLAAAGPAVELLLLQQAGIAAVHLRGRCSGSRSSAFWVQATQLRSALTMGGRRQLDLQRDSWWCIAGWLASDLH